MTTGGLCATATASGGTTRMSRLLELHGHVQLRSPECQLLLTGMPRRWLLRQPRPRERRAWCCWRRSPSASRWYCAGEHEGRYVDPAEVVVGQTLVVEPHRRRLVYELRPPRLAAGTCSPVAVAAHHTRTQPGPAETAARCFANLHAQPPFSVPSQRFCRRSAGFTRHCSAQRAGGQE
jgi:hypothetical protein